MTKKSRKASRSAFIKEVMKNHKKGLSLRAAVKKSKLSVGYLKSPIVKKSRKKRTKKKTRKGSKKRRKRRTRKH